MKAVYVEISIFDSKKKESPVIPPFKHYFWVENCGIKKIGKSDINKCMKNFLKTAKIFKRKLMKDNIWALVSMDDEDCFNFEFKITLYLLDEDTKENIEILSKEIPFKLTSPLPSEFGTADSILSVILSEGWVNQLIEKCTIKEEGSRDIIETEGKIDSNFDEKTDGVKPFLVHLPLELHNRLKKYSEVRGVSMKEIICTWIEDYSVEQK